MVGNKPLRPYQIKIIEDVRQAFRDGHKSVLLQMPTGAGKTLTIVDMISKAYKNGNGTWFICHRQELVEQGSQTMNLYAIPHGIIAGGSYMNLFQPVQVCSVQTILKRMERLRAPPLIVYDEAHHLGAKSWGKIFKYLSSMGARSIGLTATPERLDGKGLDAYFTKMVNGPTPAELISMGYLSPFKVFAPSTVDRRSIKTQMGDFAKNAATEAMDKPTITGDAVEHYMKHAKGKKAIVFCCSIKHSEHVVAAFNEVGIKAEHVDGSSSHDHRSGAIKRFAAGETLVLSNVELFGEGFDIPDAEVAILLRPTQSLSLHLQQVGRVLRPIYEKGADLSIDESRKAAIASGPKPFAIILDHAGNCLTHGLPDEERNWSLQGYAAGPKKKKDDNSPTVKQCPQCYHVQQSFLKVCGSCGHVYEIKEREIKQAAGDLVEMTKEQQVQLSQERRKKAMAEQAQAVSLEDLIRLGMTRGYKQPHAWARYVAKARGGR